LQGPIDDLILDDGPVEFGNLLKILQGVLVEKAILIKEAVQHACIDFLLLFVL
jgi:hypothetical protein